MSIPLISLVLSQGIDLDIIPSTFAEDLDKRDFTPATYVVENARIKSLEACAEIAFDRSWRLLPSNKERRQLTRN